MSPVETDSPREKKKTIVEAIGWLDVSTRQMSLNELFYDEYHF